jgi:dynein heavy chain
MKRVIATDGTKDGLTGICIFFIRPRNTRAITSANISDELQCGQLDASGGLTLLQVVKEYMQLVMLPALQQGQNWGNLHQKQIDGFMSTFKSYISFLQSMFFSSSAYV